MEGQMKKDVSKQLKILDSFLDRQLIAYEDLDKSLVLMRDNYVRNGDEEGAKQVWILKKISTIQQIYLAVFQLLKDKKYYLAWQELERCEISITNLARHYDYKTNSSIAFVDEYVKKYQRLFPYRLFSSYEMVHEEIKCSICNQIITPRNFCGHKVGEVYRGEMCGRIISKSKMLGLAIVKNPVNKYAVLFPGGMENDTYRYDLLDYLLPRLNTPFAKWELSITKKAHPIEKFSHIGRNAKCPCGSKKKFKNCCMNKPEIETDHHCFTFDEVPYQGFNSENVLTF